MSMMVFQLIEEGWYHQEKGGRLLLLQMLNLGAREMGLPL
jgi:hypothetical protein